jgi:hypothetical protein
MFNLGSTVEVLREMIATQEWMMNLTQDRPGWSLTRGAISFPMRSSYLLSRFL